MGRHNEAVGHFTAVLALQPGNARALFRRGMSKFVLKVRKAPGGLEKVEMIWEREQVLQYVMCCTGDGPVFA